MNKYQTGNCEPKIELWGSRPARFRLPSSFARSCQLRSKLWPHMGDFAIAALSRAAPAQQQHRAAPWPTPQPAPSRMPAAISAAPPTAFNEAANSKAMASRAASSPPLLMLRAFSSAGLINFRVAKASSIVVLLRLHRVAGLPGDEQAAYFIRAMAPSPILSAPRLSSSLSSQVGSISGTEPSSSSV